MTEAIESIKRFIEVLKEMQHDGVLIAPETKDDITKIAADAVRVGSELIHNDYDTAEQEEGCDTKATKLIEDGKIVPPTYVLTEDRDRDDTTAIRKHLVQISKSESSKAKSDPDKES